MMGAILILLLRTECKFAKKEIFAANFFQKIFQKRLPMKYYNNLICKALQNSFGKTFYESSKILPFRSFGTSVLRVPKPELVDGLGERRGKEV